MAEPAPKQSPQRIDLEAKITFLERTVEMMSQAMHEQGTQIDNLERQLTALTSKLEGGEDEPEFRPHDEPPPHY